MKNKRLKILLMLFIIILISSQFFIRSVYATNIPIPDIGINIGVAEEPEEVVSSLQLLLLIMLIAMAPFLLLMVTCFTRIIITLHFVRSALGTQQMPPNQILIGLALFLTLFIMSSTLDKINVDALQPFMAKEITQEVAIERATVPIKEFMLGQVEKDDVAMFAGLAKETYETEMDIPFKVLAPAFIIGELKQGFTIGFIIYIPFIVIDMVVASVLMAMGMMMLPPAMISLPFKILLFISIDGWNLIIQAVAGSFAPF